MILKLFLWNILGAILFFRYNFYISLGNAIFDPGFYFLACKKENFAKFSEFYQGVKIAPRPLFPCRFIILMAFIAFV